MVANLTKLVNQHCFTLEFEENIDLSHIYWAVQPHAIEIRETSYDIKKSKKSGWYKKSPVLVMSDWTILDPSALYLTVLFKLWPKNMQRWQFVPNDSAPHSDGRTVKKQETRNLCLNRKRESTNDVNSVSSSKVYFKKMSKGTELFWIFTACNCTLCNLLLLGKSHFFWK